IDGRFGGRFRHDGRKVTDTRRNAVGSALAYGRMTAMKAYRFSVVIEGDKDGFFVHCPELQGCYSQGKTYGEALENIRDAVRLHLEDRLERGERIPAPSAV